MPFPSIPAVLPCVLEFPAHTERDLCSVNYSALHAGGRPYMGMEVGVASELVVAVERRRRRRRGVTRQAETRRESMYSKKAALPA